MAYYYFTKTLSVSDVKKQMAVKSNFMVHLPANIAGGTVYFPVTDAISGTVWQFGYYIRNDGHLKPVFQGDWQEFRRSKGLRTGDRITFWALGGAGTFRILAERSIKLFGQEIWTGHF